MCEQEVAVREEQQRRGQSAHGPRKAAADGEHVQECQAAHQRVHEAEAELVAGQYAQA